MNHISLIGVIASAPATFRLRSGQTYSSFLLRVHGSYLDTERDPYSYSDQHAIVCVGALDRFIHTAPPEAQIEVEGELRSRLHVLHLGGPVQIEVAYYRAEVVADSIRFSDHSESSKRRLRRCSHHAVCNGACMISLCGEAAIRSLSFYTRFETVDARHLMGELIYIGGFSGGIYSQAAARFILNRYGAARVVLVNSDAGGNEHPLTIEHIDWYSEHVHPVVRVQATVRDMWMDPETAAERGPDPDEPLTFVRMAEIRILPPPACESRFGLCE